MGRRRAPSSRVPASPTTRGLTLDAGALIAIERSDKATLWFLDQVRSVGGSIAVPAAALAQVWRASPRQHALAVLLRDEEVGIVPLDLTQALAIGMLLASVQTTDVVDASVVATARRLQHAVLTTDPEDIRRLDPTLGVIAI